MSNTYEENVKIWKEAYSSILAECDKYPNFDNQYSFRDIDTMRTSAKGHLMLIDWYEKYGLKISHDYNPERYDYIDLGKYTTFNHFGNGEHDKAKGSGRFISWSDDGRQPKDEWLLNISFSTGAYIFGEDYEGQQQVFQDFISELKSYNPNYSDTVNESFYWKLENAKPIFDEFKSILNKYHDLNRLELNKRKAERLKKELAELEGKP